MDEYFLGCMAFKLFSLLFLVHSCLEFLFKLDLSILSHFRLIFQFLKCVYLPLPLIFFLTFELFFFLKLLLMHDIRFHLDFLLSTLLYFIVFKEELFLSLLDGAQFHFLFYLVSYHIVKNLVIYLSL